MATSTMEPCGFNVLQHGTTQILNDDLSVIDSYVFFLNMVSHRLNLDEGDVNVIFVIRHGNFLKLNWDGKTRSFDLKCNLKMLH